jgi:hypothetical protein
MSKRVRSHISHYIDYLSPLRLVVRYAENRAKREAGCERRVY